MNLHFTDIMANLLNMHESSVKKIVEDIYDMGINISNFTLRHPVVQKFIETDHEFDVVILEIFLSEPMLGFAHRFNAPVIGFSTFGASKWTTDLVGSPSPLSYAPHPFLR
jgi:hypothetical protein